MSEGPGNGSSPGSRRVTVKRRIDNTVVALGVVSLFTDIASEMVYTQVPIFLTRVVGASPQIVGLIEGVAESTASLLKLGAGRLSDISGRRKPLTIAGYGLGAVAKPLLYFATAWPMVLGLRFLDRAGKGIRTAPRDAMIAEVTAPDMRGRAFGLHRAMDTAGAVLGPLLGIWFLSLFIASTEVQLRSLFLFAGLPGILAVLTLLFFVRERQACTEPVPAAAADKGPILLRWSELNPTYRRFLMIAFLFNLGNSSDAFLILRANHLGYNNEALLWLYAAFNVVEAVLGYAAGGLSDRVGRRPLMIAGYGVFAIVYLGFALVSQRTSAAIWPLFLLYGGYYTLTQGTQRAFAADFADPTRRGAQIGVYHMTVGIALLPASLIGGLLYHMNPSAPFVVGASTAAVCALLLLTLPAAPISRPKPAA